MVFVEARQSSAWLWCCGLNGAHGLGFEVWAMRFVVRIVEGMAVGIFEFYFSWAV